jgi:hypothetical protein
MADGELLRAYFERHLEPGDLDHELPASAATAGIPYPGAMPGAGYSLVPDGWRREGEFWVSPEIVARIAHVREELRRRCAVGERVLWGRPVFGRLGPPEPVDIPLSGWPSVRFLPKASRLEYLGLVWDAVEVRAPEPAAAAATEIRESPRLKLGDDPPRRERGRPTMKATVEKAFSEISDEEIDFTKPMTCVYPKVRRRITGSTAKAKGLGDEALRKVIRPLFEARKTSRKL